MYFHRFYQYCHYDLRILIHCGSWVVIASTWPPFFRIPVWGFSLIPLKAYCMFIVFYWNGPDYSRGLIRCGSCIAIASTWSAVLVSCLCSLPSSLCRLAHATNTATSQLLMCWEGGWEWARLTIVLDAVHLDSYSYSYSYSYYLLPTTYYLLPTTH